MFSVHIYKASKKVTRFGYIATDINCIFIWPKSDYCLALSLSRSICQKNWCLTKISKLVEVSALNTRFWLTPSTQCLGSVVLLAMFLILHRLSGLLWIFWMLSSSLDTWGGSSTREGASQPCVLSWSNPGPWSAESQQISCCLSRLLDNVGEDNEQVCAAAWHCVIPAVVLGLPDWSDEVLFREMHLHGNMAPWLSTMAQHHGTMTPKHHVHDTVTPILYHQPPSSRVTR